MILDGFFNSLSSFVEETRDFFSMMFYDFFDNFLMNICCISNLFGFSTAQEEISENIYESVHCNQDGDENETTIEDPYKNNELEIFNLLKQHSIDEL